MSERVTYVYFIATADRSMVKIGCSACPQVRVENLAAWSPQPLEILAFVRGGYADERAMHGRFFSSHSHHEWFRATPELMALISELATHKEMPAKYRGDKTTGNPLLKVGIRATPEWRAKISEIHKARWANEKKHRAILVRFEAFAKVHGTTPQIVNAHRRHEIALQRADGSWCVWDDAAVEAFMDRHDVKVAA